MEAFRIFLEAFSFFGSASGPEKLSQVPCPPPGGPVRRQAGLSARGGESCLPDNVKAFRIFLEAFSFSDSVWLNR
jgi:hypothetical protein